MFKISKRRGGGGGLANDFINDYEHEITDKKNEALSHSQEESSSCKKEHERYQSKCGNETISDDMRNDDAAVLKAMGRI